MISVNGLQIDDNVSYIVEELTFRSMPKRNFQVVPISRRPGDKLTAAEWESKTINVKGRVFSTTVSGLRNAVDTLQQNFAVKGLAFNIDSDRTYTASLQKMDIPTQFYNLTMVQYDADFFCVNPFAYGSLLTASGTVVSGTITYSGTVTISGTVFAEPTLTINPIGSGAGNSNILQFQFGYSPTGEIVTVSGIINYKSDLVANYANFTITNSGVTSDYSGIFSRWEPGVTGFTLSTISGSHLGYNWKITYSPKYYE